MGKDLCRSRATQQLSQSLSSSHLWQVRQHSLWECLGGCCLVSQSDAMHPLNALKITYQRGLQLYASTLTTCLSAGMAKGKQQLRMRLEMLLWAITHSRALPSHTTNFLRGKGYLFFPKSSSVRTLVAH